MAPSNQPTRVFYLFIAVLTVHAGAGHDQAPSSIVGSWRGTSTCADLVNFPACHDEEVIYDVSAQPGTADTVLLRADKVVNGVRESMGELTFVRGADDSWSAEFQNPRVHVRSVIVVAAQDMTGRLVDLPSGRLIRRMSLKRIGAN